MSSYRDSVEGEATSSESARARPPMLRRIIWRLLMLIYPATWLAWWCTELVQTVARTSYVPLTQSFDFLRIRPVLYLEPYAVTLGDGTIVRPGDHILEVHINSLLAKKMWKRKCHAYHAIEVDLQRIAKYLEGREGRRYVALCGRNKLQPLMHRFGGNMIDIINRPPGLRTWLEQLFEEMAILLFHPKRIQRLEKQYTVVCDTWISREGFITLTKHRRAASR